MINTYQTSLAPPPLPPRQSSSHPVLIPDSLPAQGHSKFLIRFLVCVVLLHLFLSVGGFLYLNHSGIKGKPLSAEGKVAHLSTEEQEMSHKIVARMVVEHPPTQVKEFRPGFLLWNINHSFLRGINYYHDIWLTVLEPGEYYVYSRVTFSRGDSSQAMAGKVKLRKSEKAEAKTVMQAYCNLDSRNMSASIPRLCTASQGEVVTLERGNQLSVWVQDLSRVDYEEGSTTFGMYRL